MSALQRIFQWAQRGMRNQAVCALALAAWGAVHAGEAPAVSQHAPRSIVDALKSGDPITVTTRTASANDASAKPISEKPWDDAALVELAWFRRAHRLPRFGHEAVTRTPLAKPTNPMQVVQSGDRLRIAIWGTGVPMNIVAEVAPSGAVAIGDYGAVQVAGRTLMACESAIGQIIQHRFKDGGCLIGIESYGPLVVTVSGDVAQPGNHGLPAGGTVIDAIAAAGGPTMHGTLRGIQVSIPGSATRSIDLYPLLQEGRMDTLTPLPPGASVHVPGAFAQVQVHGAVRRPMTYELLPGEHLAEAIAKAGGYDSQADSSRVHLAREGVAGQELQMLPAAQVAMTAGRDGDRLLIRRRPELISTIDYIEVSGAVMHPGAYAAPASATVGALILMAGGLTHDADPQAITVERIDSSAKTMDMGGGLPVKFIKRRLFDVSFSTTLQHRDTLILGRHQDPQTLGLTFTLSGPLRQPGVKPLAPGMTVRAALELGGGLLPDADISVFDIVRVTYVGTTMSVQRTTHPLTNILNGTEAGPVLMARDHVVIRAREDQRLRVTLRGRVKNPGEYLLAPGSTLGGLLRMSGGTTQDGILRGLRLYRQSEVQAGEQYLRELRDRIEGAITINRRKLVQTHEQDSTRELDLTVATQEAQLARLKEAKPTGRLTGIDVIGIEKQRDGADIGLRDGDVIEIPSRPDSIRIFGEVMAPGSIRWRADMRVRDVITLSGGLSEQADENRIFVVRMDGTVVAMADGRGLEWNAEAGRYDRTRLSDIRLQEGDAVIVPPDLTYSPSWRSIVRDWSTVLFNVALAAATVVAIAP